METPWLTSDELAGWLRFAAVLELLPSALDAQLSRDEDLTHFDYFTLAMLSEAPERTLRMSELAARTSATLPRLSRVIGRLERAGFVERRPCPGDRRATNAVLTPLGAEKVTRAAPGHVATVRDLVVDRLSPAELADLAAISARILDRLDPGGQLFRTGPTTAD